MTTIFASLLVLYGLQLFFVLGAVCADGFNTKKEFSTALIPFFWVGYLVNKIIKLK